MRYFEKISLARYIKDGLPKARYDIYNLPQRATAKSAGYDFFALEDINLEPGEEIMVPTGIRASMQDDEVLHIYTRSGYGFKFYLRLANQTGVIDADYKFAKNEGHIWIKLRNEGERPFIFSAWNADGTQNAIAQGVFQKYLLVDNDTFDGEERDGGFGSTG